MRNKNSKFRLVIWSVVTLILISLFVGSIKSNTRFLNIFNLIQIRDNNSYIGKSNEYTVESANLENININLTQDDIILKTTTDKDIKIVESSNYKISENEKLKISEQSKSIDIYRNNEILDWISFGNLESRRIEIYIPENYKENLSLNNNVGDVDILSDLNLKSFKVSQDVGDLNIKGNINCNDFSSKSSTGSIKAKIINTKKYTFKASIGDIDIEGISGKGTIKSSTGDISCGIDKIDGNINVISKVGDIDLYIEESLRFDINTNHKVGEIKSDFPVILSNKDNKEVMSYNQEDTLNTLTLENEVGDISITKR